MLSGRQTTIPSLPSTNSRIFGRYTSVNGAGISPAITPSNSVFVLIAFTGQGAELMRREAADGGSDLRHVLQSAVEFDVAAALSHLAISVHGVRAIAGAPAAQLVLRHKLDPVGDGGTNNHERVRTSNNGSVLYCAVVVRSAAPQQCAAIAISLRASCNNALTFRSVAKLASHVCTARPTRVVGDTRSRTRFDAHSDGGFFANVLRLEEIPESSALRPSWFIDLFSVPSHIVAPAHIERYILDGPEFLMKQHAALYSNVAGGSSTNNGNTRNKALHVVYNSPQPVAVENPAEASAVYQREQIRRAGERSSSAIVVASDEDAMFVPVEFLLDISSSSASASSSHRRNASTDVMIVSNNNGVHGGSTSNIQSYGNDPIVLSRTQL